MARVLRRSNIEMFVEAWLKKLRNVSNKRSERKYVEKAITLLTAYNTQACCEDIPEPMEFARQDNDLTEYIKKTLGGSFDRRKYRQSLDRAIEQLTFFLEDPCCV